MIRPFLLLLTIASLSATATAAAQDHWPRFRGPRADGVAPDNAGLPTTWSTTDHVHWLADVPGWGWSSPVVWADRVFLTSVISDQQNVTPSKGLYLGQGVRDPAQGVHRWMVVKPGPKFEIVQRNPLDELCLASPAVAGDKLLIRTVSKLYCLTARAAPAVDVQTDWPRWRGPADNGSTELGTYPVRFDDSTTRWRAPLPGKGCSTPIVLDRTVYLTAPVDGKDALLSFDWSGQQRWSAAFGPEVAGKHRNGSGCNASPVTDGSAVFTYFKSGTLAAVQLDGSVRWQTDLVPRFGEDERFWDHGTSPVLTDKYVVMARMHAGDSWLAAFDKTSGELAWKVARDFSTPLEGDQCYTTPLVIQHGGREAILVWGANHLTIHDATDGRAYWSCGGFNPDSRPLWPAISSPVIVGDMAVICHGRNDRGQPRLHGIRLTGSGDVTATNHVWQRDDVGAFVPSPAVYEGLVYLVRDRGEVECIDPETGETIWSDAFPKARASYYASPLIATGRLYAAREDGVVMVASVTNERLDLLAENDLDESVIGSPVPAGNCIFLRGENYLFCLTASDKDN